MQISATQPLASVADVGASGVAAEKGKKKKSGGYSVRLVTAPGLGVFSVAKVGYVPPALGASGVSLWETTNKRINVEKISAGIEFLSGKWGQFGVRYAVYGDSEMKFSKALALQTDYDVTNRQKYVEASHAVSAFSGYYNYLFKKVFGSFNIIKDGVNYLKKTSSQYRHEINVIGNTLQQIPQTFENKLKFN
jgi:hypothetical protein